MKFSLFLAAASAATLSLSSAQLTVDFSDATIYPGPEIAGTDGWTISDPTQYLSFLASVGPKNWGALGAFYDVSSDSEVTLSRSVGALAKTSTFVTKFFIQPSTPTYPGRDAFGFRFGGGTNGLLDIKFVPNDSDLLNPGKMDIYVGADGATPTPTGSSILDNTTYSLTLDFNEGFFGDLEMFGRFGVGETSYSFTAVVPSGANATWDDFAVVWYPTVDQPDNFIVFESFSAVPEPGSAMASLLAGVMGVAVTTRRRRRL